MRKNYSSAITRFALALALAAFATAPLLAHDGHEPDGASPPPLMSGLGDWHHAIRTNNPEAQKYFDQGLRLVYAFNLEEAGRSFARAAQIDPGAAMPYWGEALALGPNINIPYLPEAMKPAVDAAARALAAAQTPAEKSYAAAISNRYSLDPKADSQTLLGNYSSTMKQVMLDFPEDPDAAVLYAESLMTLRPWKLWRQDGSPAPETQEIMDVLSAVLKKWPDHLGANHYFIHTLEASPHPELALGAANKIGALAPAAGHLVHMPSHIQVRLGDFAGAIKVNQTAAKVDEDYLAASGQHGMYDMYYNHNLDFVRYAASMAGNRAMTRDYAAKSDAGVIGALKNMPDMAPMFEPFMALKPLMALRLRDWSDALAWIPAGKHQPLTDALLLFVRGAALAGQGKAKEARKAEAAFALQAKIVSADSFYGNNSGPAVLRVASAELAARIARAEKNPEQELAAWRRAAAAQDALWYYEPPDWYYPVRESLGGALLRANRPVEAEAVFRADLEQNPGNGRSLFGLMKALEAQGKSEAAGWVKQQFEKAWRSADVVLSVDAL